MHTILVSIPECGLQSDMVLTWQLPVIDSVVVHFPESLSCLIFSVVETLISQHIAGLQLSLRFEIWFGNVGKSW